jgi:hypothetical protein
MIGPDHDRSNGGNTASNRHNIGILLMKRI